MNSEILFPAFNIGGLLLGIAAVATVFLRRPQIRAEIDEKTVQREVALSAGALAQMESAFQRADRAERKADKCQTRVDELESHVNVLERLMRDQGLEVPRERRDHQ